MNFHEALNLILLLLGLLIFYRVVGDRDNPLEYWHLVSTRSADGVVYTDNDKVGQLTGLIFGTWVICWLALTGDLTTYYFAIWLVYAAGMGAFAKWARAFITDRFGSKGKQPEPEPPAPPQVTTTTTTKVVP